VANGLWLRRCRAVTSVAKAFEFSVFIIIFTFLDFRGGDTSCGKEILIKGMAFYLINMPI